MKKIETVNYMLVEFIPDNLESGIIYVSEKYKTAVHKCCCGCGEEVVTPLNPSDWSFKISSGKITLHPSIGNWSFSCRSHYWIRNGRVIWSHDMTEAQINDIRSRDRKIKEQYFERINQNKEVPASQTNWIEQIVVIVKNWFLK